MNPAAPGAPAQGSAPPGQQNVQQTQPPQQQAQRPPMYQPAHIRNLPHLTEDEKKKYEQGLRSLWTRANTSPQGSPEQNAARQKIIDFSRMLITKIQTRRTVLQQQQQDQQAPVGQPNAQGQQQQPQVGAQAQAQAQAQVPQQQQQQPQAQQPPQVQQQPQAQAQQTPAMPQQQQQQQQQAQPQAQAQAQAQGIARPPSAQQTAPLQAPTPGTAQTPQQQQAQPQQQNVANAGAPATNTAAGQAQKPKISDQLLQYVNKMIFRPPHHIAEKSTAEAAKWIEEMRERYARALMTMEGSKKKLAQLEQWFNERKQQGNPLKDDELRTYTIRKEQQLKLYTEAHKWVEGIRKQQGMIGGQANQNAAGATPAAQQNADTPQPVGNAGATNAQNTAQGIAGATEAARQQALAGNRASPANGVSTPTQQPPPPPRPTPSVNQPAVPQVQAQPPAQPQHQTQPQPQPQGQPQPPPVNTALASAAAAAQNQGVGTPTQTSARVQTPQSATPVTAGGPTRALSHSMAMTLANQRAVGTPGSAPVPGPQASGGTPTPTGGAAPPSAIAPSLPQQGHPHAHPSQSQQTIQSKMPIPKHLPERATSVPQGVTMGGGVNPGRPSMSQGGGTLGGVMNQPAVPKIPAYSHEAEGDHVLSKKKLDELVRQVCGGAGEGQEGNLLTPEVEENVLSMADSFVDNVLHAACRNAKERGSKVLEIRDIQLILERTYNIRVPGYSSDELRTVRKVQPSSGWIAKMSAVQAAKVMPGKTD